MLPDDVYVYFPPSFSIVLVVAMCSSVPPFSFAHSDHANDHQFIPSLPAPHLPTSSHFPDLKRQPSGNTTRRPDQNTTTTSHQEIFSSRANLLPFPQLFCRRPFNSSSPVPPHPRHLVHDCSRTAHPPPSTSSHINKEDSSTLSTSSSATSSRTWSW